MGRMDGRVAVVTGGGNGIGRASCLRLADEGADVVVADLQSDAAEKVAGEVRERGRNAVAVTLDAADEASNDAMCDAAVSELGGLDVLVTAAGISHGEYVSGDLARDQHMIAKVAEVFVSPEKAVLDLDVAGWQRVLDVNLTGTLLAIRSATKRTLEVGRGGSYVTIASIAAKHPEAGPPAYTVSKAGVWMLTKNLARSLAPVGIRLNAIGPGFIETNMTRVLTDTPGIWELFKPQVPMGRMGTADEMAAVAAFLASDDASYVTGEILHADGGFYTE